MRLCVLASGSKGNSIFVQYEDQAIVIDCGLSGKEFKKRLDFAGLSEEAIKAIIISHEHSDHISGAGILSRKYGIPLYINQKTFEAAEKKIGKTESTVFFECGESFQIDTFIVHPFSISHDTEDPAGFTVTTPKGKLGIATDLGVASLVVKQHLKECNVLVLEANHDPGMLLENENYPWPLKQRVKGRHGHLSNEESAQLIQEVLHSDLNHVIMAHLSEENNLPEKVERSIQKAIHGRDIKISIASQNTPSDVIPVNRQKN
jgi:phosphoribosyl 1,2-cyclic phosphodiesterase